MNNIELKILKILKKYFTFEFEEESYKGNVWGRLLIIQAKEDEGKCDCIATSNLVEHIEDFNLLKEFLK